MSRSKEKIFFARADLAATALIQPVAGNCYQQLRMPLSHIGNQAFTGKSRNLAGLVINRELLFGVF